MSTINYQLSPGNEKGLYFVVQRRTGNIHKSSFPATGIFKPFETLPEAQAYSEKIKNDRTVYYAIDSRNGEIHKTDRKKAGPYRFRLSETAALRVAVQIKRRNLKRKVDEYNAALDEYLSSGGNNPDGFIPVIWNI